MAFDFPTSPTNGQTYPAVPVAGQPVYTWDGEKWASDPGLPNTPNNLTITKATPAVILDKTASGQQSIVQGNKGGVARWAMVLGDLDAESGSNAGSSFNLYPALDNGAFQPSVLAIARATGLGTVVGDPTAPLGIATKQYAEQYALLTALAQTVAARKNYIINGAMVISQQWAGNVLSGNGQSPADMFDVRYANSGGGVLSFLQSANRTPGGSPFRLRCVCTTTGGGGSAGDIAYIHTSIEGTNVSDLKWGTAAAKAVTVRFGVKAAAGTYTLSIGNHDSNRSYLASFVISAGEANTEVVKTITIPGDTTGTWRTDNTGVGFFIGWALHSGSTYGNGAAGWQAGFKLAITGQYNFLSVASNVFELFDVGLYEGSIAPTYQVPEYSVELLKCQRYLEYVHCVIVSSGPSVWGYQQMGWKVIKRIPPTLGWQFDAGSGAQFTNMSGGNTGFYQGAAHDRIGTALVSGDARM